MPPLNLGFSNLSDTRLDVLSFSIITGFTNNPTYFPAPHPELDAATAAQTAFSEALAEARGGSLVSKVIKNQKRDELIDALVGLGSWGTIKAAGDPVILAATNFPLRKSPGTSSPLGAAEIKTVQLGATSGEARVTANRTVRAKWYRFEYCLDPTAGEWQGQNSTRIKVLFTGLEAGPLYYFRVTADGINDQESVSSVVQKMVY